MGLGCKSLKHREIPRHFRLLGQWVRVDCGVTAGSIEGFIMDGAAFTTPQASIRPARRVNPMKLILIELDIIFTLTSYGVKAGQVTVP
jgi:hypothetical protein